MDEEQTLDLIQRIWSFFLIGLYLSCFMNEHYFPGFRETPLEGEEIFWDVQRVLFLGLMALGFLADLLRMKMERNLAYAYLVTSLIAGGFASLIGVYQYRAVTTVLQLAGGEMAQGE